MNNIDKIVNDFYENNKEKANQKIKTGFSPELYSKIISIYNEFIRNYSVKDEDVDLKIFNKQGQLSDSIYSLIKKDAQKTRALNLQEEYKNKLMKLHDLKINSYKENIYNQKINQNKNRLVEIIKLEKDIINIKNANINIDTTLENNLEQEENKYELYITNNFKDTLEDIDKQNNKLDAIENKMISLNKKLSLNEISMVEYNKSFGELEEEKVDVIWGLTILNPSLLKEKHIQIVDEREKVHNGIGEKLLAQKNKFLNSKIKSHDLSLDRDLSIISEDIKEEIDDTNESNLKIKNSEEEVIKDLDKQIEMLPVNSPERIRLEAMRNIKKLDLHQAKELNETSKDQMESKSLDKEEIESTTIRTTTTKVKRTTVIEETNEFVVYLQSKVKVNQDPNNIIEVANAQILRDRTRNDSREIDLLVR